MKTLVKILAIILVITSLANFINIRKEKDITHLQNKTNQIVTNLNHTLLSITYQTLYHTNTQPSKGLKINIDSKNATLFSTFTVKFENFRSQGQIINGTVKVVFTGFTADNKPCYKFIYPAKFFVTVDNKKFQVFGTEKFCFTQGFYTFNTQDDDLITLDGSLNVKYGRTLLKVKDKDIKLKLLKPVKGIRIILNKTLEEQVFDFNVTKSIPVKSESLAK